jgi:hypothetical protein
MVEEDEEVQLIAATAVMMTEAGAGVVGEADEEDVMTDCEGIAV